MHQCDNDTLSNPLLHRYWFKTRVRLGYGVTAFALEDARQLLADCIHQFEREPEFVSIIEDVEVSTLDPGHVLPDMGPPNFRGVGYPRINL